MADDRKGGVDLNRVAGAILARLPFGTTRHRLRKRLSMALAKARARAGVRDIHRKLERVDRGGPRRAVSTGAVRIGLMNVTSSPGVIGFPSLVGPLMHRALALRGGAVQSWHCARGLVRCQPAVRRDDPLAAPPCDPCVALRGGLFAKDQRFDAPLDPGVARALPLDPSTDSLETLLAVEFEGLPLGQMCVPSLRRGLRRYHLHDDPVTRTVAIQFLHSAAMTARAARRFLQAHRPDRMVVFNGIAFPEAVTRAVCLEAEVPVVTYEIGYRPMSLFLSHRFATDYEIPVPEDSALTPAEEARLDELLAARFKGRFDMGGLLFWPEMTGFAPDLQQRLAGHREMVLICANTPYDTSMAHADGAFASMFQWLEATLALAEGFPDTLFVVRAHPDEVRYGKPYSNEPVAGWLAARGWADRPNVVLIDAANRVSTYELINAAKLCITYNSTIGIEAAILGRPVLCAGRAKYADAGFALSAESDDAYVARLRQCLEGGAALLDGTQRAEARRFFYFMMFKASIDLSAFFEVTTMKTSKGAFRAERYRPLRADKLMPGACDGLDVVCRGILEGTPFLHA